jgi:hypothetical protein
MKPRRPCHIERTRTGLGQDQVLRPEVVIDAVARSHHASGPLADGLGPSNPRCRDAPDLPADRNANHELAIPANERRRLPCKRADVTLAADNRAILSQGERLPNDLDIDRTCGDYAAPHSPSAPISAETWLSLSLCDLFRQPLDHRLFDLSLAQARLHAAPPPPDCPDRLGERRRSAGGDTCKGWERADARSWQGCMSGQPTHAMEFFQRPIRRMPQP